MRYSSGLIYLESEYDAGSDADKPVLYCWTRVCQFSGPCPL